MITYDLYLESGPRRRKTMVHVLDLLGCIAVGPTTEDAIAATPEAIACFRRFLHRSGEPIDREAVFDTRIAEHLTTGSWMGNGSPYFAFGPDLDPITDAEVECFLHRFRSMREALADWCESQAPADLDVKPPSARTARAIILHVLGPTGAYLSAALGSAPGFSRIHGAAERREIDLTAALRQSAVMAVDRVHTATPEERAAVRQLSSGPRTLRKSLRRLLEHEWEHLAELARRPGGPIL
ncbi:MAG: type II toxin-antitoxin system HicB family antitoxin [Dehalococcoidia bacterium]